MKFLLVKLNHIGDTLIMTPTIHAIREAYPDARIDVVVRKGCEGILEGNPDIDNVFTIARPEKGKRSLPQGLKESLKLLSSVAFRRYDYAFDLSNSDRAKLIIALSFAKRRGINRWHAKLGWKKYLFTDFSDYAWGKHHQVLKDFNTVKEILDFSLEPGPLRISTQAIDALALKQRFALVEKPYIVIHPTSRWSFKEWEVSRWREVIDFLAKQGYEIIITCGPDPREIDTAETLAKGFSNVKLTRGKTTLRELGVLIENARLFIGVDTVAMHIAAAVDTPVVALFGPSSEWSWSPWQVPYRLVLGDCPCKISRKFTCDKSKLLPCMESIKTSEILQAVNDLMKETTET
ncbi:putative lipopolysaccharide heptosyltransferase III [Nitratifractor sp.]